MARPRKTPDEIRAARRTKRAALKRAKLKLYGQNLHRFQLKYGRSRDVSAVWQLPRFRRGQSAHLKVPPIFCFLQDPEGALRFLGHLRRTLANQAIRSIHLDHKGCKHLGLDASVIMDTMLLEEQARRTRKKIRLYLSGTHPDDIGVKNMLRATGILRSINHPDSHLPDPEELRIIRCPTLRGDGKKPEASWTRDAAGTKIIEYFQKCLLLHNVELAPQGVAHMADLVTEALGNSEEHGGVWYAIGFYVQRKDSDSGTCHLVLFNEGNTIYESMSAPNASEEIKRRVSALAETHMKRGWFGFGPRVAWDVEALWTLYALQQGVSSKLHERPSRGNGTVEVISAFAELAGPGRRMCILSGSSYILFDGQYSLGESTFEGDSRQVLAFNSSNDLEQPPDPGCVRALDGRYDGTIISLRFTLEKEHLQKLAGRND